MQKKTYADKQREAQQLKKQEELRARANKSPAPDSPEADAVAKAKEEKKTSKRTKA
jgi:hypothetical protein